MGGTTQYPFHFSLRKKATQVILAADFSLYPTISCFQAQDEDESLDVNFTASVTYEYKDVPNYAGQYVSIPGAPDAAEVDFQECDVDTCRVKLTLVDNSWSFNVLSRTIETR